MKASDPEKDFEDPRTRGTSLREQDEALSRTIRGGKIAR